MDRYTKAVLTVIAVALTAIAAHMWAPQDAVAAPFGLTASTVGDFLDAAEIKDPKKAEEATQRARRGMLVVRVQGGSVSVN